VSKPAEVLHGSDWRVEVRRLSGDDEARACARIMNESEPWITLGRTFDTSLLAVTNPERETWVAVDGEEVAGFVILCLQGAFVGYLQTIALRADWRSRGLGRALLGFTERRLFAEGPNVFLCVSSFNPRARKLYERLGYEPVGVLRDFIVQGHDELLMRKTIGSVDAYRRGEIRAPGAPR
jgi:ribosomal protein S18 acetylase RimI-like enzyme